MIVLALSGRVHEHADDVYCLRKLGVQRYANIRWQAEKESQSKHSDRVFWLDEQSLVLDFHRLYKYI